MCEQYSGLDAIYPFVLSACFAGEAPKMNSIVKPATVVQLCGEIRVSISLFKMRFLSD